MTQTPSQIEAEVLTLLRAKEGNLWCEVQGELQELDAECAIWILLYEDSDIRQSHAGFCEIVQPFMEALAPIEFTLSYTILTDILDISEDTLMSNDDILKGLEDISLGKRPITKPRQKFSVFTSEVSGMRPS